MRNPKLVLLRLPSISEVKALDRYGKKNLNSSVQGPCPSIRKEKRPELVGFIDSRHNPLYMTRFQQFMVDRN